MAEGARLESVYTATYRGFESPPHRHLLRRARTKVRAFFSHVAYQRGDEKPRPGFDYWRSQLDRPGAQRTGCPAGASKASQSPPHRHILRRARTQVRAFFSHVAHLRGMRSPDRGSTAGAASWTDRERSEWAARRASKASQSPPHRHILRRARTKVRAFFSHIAHLRGDEKPRPVMCWRQTTKPGFPGLEDRVLISCKR